MRTVKKNNNLIITILIITIFIVTIFVLLHILEFYKSKTLTGTIINNNSNHFEIITENDSIYKFNYKTIFDIGDNIKITYNKKLDDSKSIQKINIKQINKENITVDIDNKALKLLNNMTLKEKIGQLLLIRTPEIDKIDTIKKYNPAGYILFQRDIKNKTKEELINEISLFQETANIPMFIAIDEEGGTVSRLSTNKNIVKDPFISPQELYKKGGFEKIREDSIIKMNLLKELGINMNLAPVADISTDPTSFIYERSFGKNKNETAKYIKTVLKTQSNDVSYVLKHFPGYSNNLDTHKGLAIDNRPYKIIKNNDFLPFKVGIKNGANAIMVSHNIITSIDNKPATLSRNIHNILRNELNFNGIIITDDMSMGAIKKYNTNTPYIDSVLAGNNIIIVTDYIDAYEEIYNAVIEDKITEELISKLVLKTLQFKLNLNLYN